MDNQSFVGGSLDLHIESLAHWGYRVVDDWSFGTRHDLVLSMLKGMRRVKATTPSPSFHFIGRRVVDISCIPAIRVHDGHP